MTIKAKFAGTCKLCGDEWSKDFDIHYSREPRAICGSRECFDKQLANSPQQSSGSNGYQRQQEIVTIRPEIEISRSMLECEDTVRMAIAKAHDMTKVLYPELGENTHTFGQIRSKFTDQLLSVYFFKNT
jgi:hypothetical protein